MEGARGDGHFGIDTVPNTSIPRAIMMTMTAKPLAAVHHRSSCSPCTPFTPGLHIRPQHTHLQAQKAFEKTPGRCEKHHRSTVLQAAATLQDAPTQLDVSKMEPLGDRILIMPEEEKNVTEGGLMLTTGATKTISDAIIGKVLAKGEDVDIAVDVGNKVIFTKYSSSDVKVPEGEIVFVAQKSVLAVLS
ncbi:hypothetical protein CVIRNUC_002094 [Coccomyxa viridis]|uniref:10 kDa chaperonin n=1 Tax=Coccomyxa viridis TaxID=1274662 RepID=A0AAV1HV77_9CHLO|nr:hypothetical protein CVIRNUC_002094 [Coccomyxa viridis]